MFCQRKDLHGLTALRSSLAPPVLPLSLPGHITAQIHWLWSFHANCLWSGFDLPNFAYTITVVHGWEDQGRIQGIHKVDSNSVHLSKLIEHMNDLLSTWDLASLQSYSSVPHMPCNIPSFPAAMLPVPSTSAIPPQYLELSPCPQPSFVCFAGCERNCSAALVVLQIAQLGQLRESRILAEQLEVCRLHAAWLMDALLTVKTCYFSAVISSFKCIALHCIHSAELVYSVRNQAHYLPAFSFPRYDCFLLDGGAYLVLIAKLKQKAVTCGTSF